MEIIDLLLKQGVITAEEVEKARGEAKRTGIKLEKALEKLGFIREEDIVKAIADASGIPYMDLDDYIVDTALIKLIPENLARKYRAVPLFKIANTLTVATTDAHNIDALDRIRKSTGIDSVEPVLASERSIQKVLDAYYGSAGSVDEIIASLEKEKSFDPGKALMEVAEEPPIIKLVNIMITEAVRERASDIHIEPEQDALGVRYRIDGILREAHILPKKFQNAVLSRVKVLASMDIAENRRPQDGKIRLRIENRDVDIRVSTFPTVHGENAVLRLLDKTSVILGLKDLGFPEDNLKAFERLIRQPNGIILVTGPTGSGKTTTLYSALATISSVEKNIITIEDPVEYEIPLIRQTQVNPKADITFANGLRSILRQDPDVIMVGEIRDKETADVAIQASLTGHLVFSTLHTNDASSALTRLIDMGVEPFLISSSVIGILAQRLVRTTCDKCKEPYAPDDATLEDLGLKDQKLAAFRGRGCDVCKQTGFRGRTAIFELLVVSEEIRKMINAKASAEEVKKKAVGQGMKDLRGDGLDKIRKGITSIDEVLRVTEIE